MPWRNVPGSKKYQAVYVNPCPGYPLGRILFVAGSKKVEVPENEVEKFLFYSLKTNSRFDTNLLINYFTENGVLEHPIEEFI